MTWSQLSATEDIDALIRRARTDVDALVEGGDYWFDAVAIVAEGPSGGLSGPFGTTERAIVFGPELLPHAKLAVGTHVVQPGEYPSTIIRRYGMSNEWLQLLNPDYEDTRLGAGQTKI